MISRIAVALLVCGALAFPAGASTATKETDPLPPKRSAKVQKKWGIEIVAVRTSAAGRMIDFRYRVMDSDKAAFLTDRNLKAYLVDEESGLVLSVPNTAKLGPLRQTTPYTHPDPGRIYFMLFGNTGRVVHSGSKVTLAVGDVRIKNLVVQ